MSAPEKPFFNGLSFTIMINGIEVTLSPHRQFTNLAFNNVDLSHLNLFSCKFENCTFVECNLLDTDWSGTSFTDCIFDVCDFTSSVMYETVLKDCKFTKCDLTGMRMYKSNFDKVHISSCTLDSMRVIGAELASTKMEDCTINGAEFRNCVIACCALRNVKAVHSPLGLSLVGITHSTLSEVELHEAELDECIFISTDIIRCNFWQSSLHGPYFLNCTISHTGLNETMMRDGVFYTSPLFGCRMRLAHLDTCIFDESDIVACAIAGTDLSRTILHECALINNRYTEGGDFPAVLKSISTTKPEN